MDYQYLRTKKLSEAEQLAIIFNHSGVQLQMVAQQRYYLAKNPFLTEKVQTYLSLSSSEKDRQQIAKRKNICEKAQINLSLDNDACVRTRLLCNQSVAEDIKLKLLQDEYNNENMGLVRNNSLDLKTAIDIYCQSDAWADIIKRYHFALYQQIVTLEQNAIKAQGASFLPISNSEQKNAIIKRLMKRAIIKKQISFKNQVGFRNELWS